MPFSDLGISPTDVAESEEASERRRRARLRRSRRMLERLRSELEAARARGEAFSEAWPRARRRALRLLNSRGPERREWLPVLDETEHEWRRCYLGEPAGEHVEKLGQLEEAAA